MGRRLAAQKIDALYSSPLKRALRTAQEIAEFVGRPVVTSERLKEINLGKFEGNQFKGVEGEGRLLEAAWESGKVDFPIDGGETVYQVQARAAAFLASEYNGFITGATLDINGGVYMA